MYKHMVKEVTGKPKFIYLQGCPNTFGYRARWQPISFYLRCFCWLMYILGHLLIVSLCLLAEPLESNLMVFLRNWNSRLIWLFQTGTEADDTAIICSFRCSIDSRCTLSAADGDLRLLDLQKKYAKVRTTHAREHTQAHTHTHTTTRLCLIKLTKPRSHNTRAQIHINLKESDSWNHIMNSNHRHFHNAKT